jgi:hypothetical protein|eukprot:scaffold8625_cov180-Alexandrium_tamarense.AAC.5
MELKQCLTSSTSFSSFQTIDNNFGTITLGNVYPTHQTTIHNYLTKTNYPTTSTNNTHNTLQVVNLERDLYNLRTQIASLTGATVDTSLPLATQSCDAGGGGEEADAIRAKINKKETDLSMERRAVFKGWLKNVFLGQALISMALSYVMSTNPDAIFGSFGWYNNISNMDTSIQVLGFWWWWLFIVPSLRSRRPTGMEKKALDIAFLGTPLISLLSPVVTKDTGVIWLANFAVVAGAYGFAFLGGEDDDEEGDDGEGESQPGWLKFIYKSLDFGSGRERGARR